MVFDNPHFANDVSMTTNTSEAVWLCKNSKSVALDWVQVKWDRISSAEVSQFFKVPNKFIATFPNTKFGVSTRWEGNFLSLLDTWIVIFSALDTTSCLRRKLEDWISLRRSVVKSPRSPDSTQRVQLLYAPVQTLVLRICFVHPKRLGDVTHKSTDHIQTVLSLVESIETRRGKRVTSQEWNLQETKSFEHQDVSQIECTIAWRSSLSDLKTWSRLPWSEFSTNKHLWIFEHCSQFWTLRRSCLDWTVPTMSDCYHLDERKQRCRNFQLRLDQSRRLIPDHETITKNLTNS